MLTFYALYYFSDMLIATLFKPGTKINPEHRPKYVHTLAYASCVSEIYKKVLAAWSLSTKCVDHD